MCNNKVDEWYAALMLDIMDNGNVKTDRTGTGTKSLFGRTFRHHMRDGFPLLTSKKMYTKGVITELLWFLKGSTDIRELWKDGCHIWDGDWYKRYVKTCSTPYSIKEIEQQLQTGEGKLFPDSMFDLGPIYGKQWRDWNGIDQVADLVNELRVNPDSRRLIVTAWNPSNLSEQILPPCHYGFQCYTRELTPSERYQLFRRKRSWTHLGHKDIPVEALAEDSRFGFEEYPSIFTSQDINIMNRFGIPTRELSLSWKQRSVDVPLGLPFNIASYGFLLEMLAHTVNMAPGELIGELGDTHIYLNQVNGVIEQLSSETYTLPTLNFSPLKTTKSIDDFRISDFIISNYFADKVIKYPLSN